MRTPSRPRHDHQHHNQAVRETGGTSLAALAELDVELTEAGSDTISGTPVRRFDVRGDLEELVPIGLLGGLKVEAVQLWIDDDDRLRRVDWISSEVGGARVEYSDFGVEVEPKPISADETCSFDAWFGYALRDF